MIEVDPSKKEVNKNSGTTSEDALVYVMADPFLDEPDPGGVVSEKGRSKPSSIAGGEKVTPKKILSLSYEL